MKVSNHLLAASAAPLPTRREDLLARLTEPQVWDLLVVGGGATGLGVAWQAAREGLKVALLEARDFAQGTSSRSTKLVHGGVRYLAQGHWPLVREALHERRGLLERAPHLAQPLAFVMPTYRRGEQAFYGAGLKLYECLAASVSLGKTRFLNAQMTQASIPGVRVEGLRGGVQYWDGQFDDARLALALARSAASKGACVVNRVSVQHLLYENGRVAGVRAQDAEQGQAFDLKAACVINATGVWVDDLRLADGHEQKQAMTRLVTLSQGVHLVVDASFWPGDKALLVPKTADGRVLFAVPWLGKVLLGTTDTARPDAPIEPRPASEEVDLILKEAGRYLKKAPRRSDVLSAWAGLRPLVRADSSSSDASGLTQKISREHHIEVSRAGLVTVTGGKWTTYSAMAQDVMQQARRLAGLKPAGRAVTENERLIGAPNAGEWHPQLTRPAGAHLYGSEQGWLEGLPGAQVVLAPGLTEAMVRFAARYEYARSVEDVLARRSRCLFLDATLAKALAPTVAQILRQELAIDPGQAAFEALAAEYAYCP
ncbi:glycerol-3-phosphate dehydrogenase/oxidase [Limnohabitans sp. Hippo3]|uniref:glycerol-3-phosphate dehydrogenase/oxidase n=1 Tax=Limnohabitans sp. Hippo3 TaxID=1597956 RepID=UPI000D347D19|nr:glycerol-3-phosphate dehydrogenase/oxidase [Limnohabitans sp. Hippo3]PUE36919.1 FAD-dependent oxidoreductase [Limnohabitans sp. Hippo3]